MVQMIEKPFELLISFCFQVLTAWITVFLGFVNTAKIMRGNCKIKGEVRMEGP